MADAKIILDIAAAEIGTTEEPPHSNHVKYNTAFYGSEVSGGAYPWCCAFVWWVFRQANAAELFYGGQRTASCTELYRYYLKEGQTIPAAQAQPGDLVFFVFDGNKKGVMNHIGICESCADGHISTIDGNTGTESDANGGHVMRRKRPLGYVGGVARPWYKEEDDMTEDQVRKIVQTAVDTAVKSLQPKVYTSLAEIPAWAKALVARAVSDKVVKGDGSGGLRLTDDNLVSLQMLYNLADSLKK